MLSPSDSRAAVLEICVDSIDGVAAAIAGGADRIELCSALAVGGLTPSPGLVAAAIGMARPHDVTVHAMVRPREGGFLYPPSELEIVRADTSTLAALGVDGLVFGAGRPDGRLAIADLRAWMKIVRQLRSRERRPIAATLHRAIDLVPDLDEAVDAAIAIGFDHILSSGGSKTALDGVAAIDRMIARAGGRCAIIAGAGITENTISAILAKSRARQIHASATRALPEDQPLIARFGFGGATRRNTDPAIVRALRTALDAAFPTPMDGTAI